MPSVRQIRGRIRSVRNTARVTRAMQMVAASKMRRAQEATTASRPYAEKLREVLGGLVGVGAVDPDLSHPLLERRPVSNVLLLSISPDRGLAGGMPGNLSRASGEFLRAQMQQHPVAVITVGKKVRDFMVRAGADLRASFTDITDRPTMADTLAVTHLVQQMYTSGEVDEVHIAYTRYVNTLVQQPMVRQLLPIAAEGLEDESARATDYIYEPDAGTVLGALLPRFFEMQVYQAFLENSASEQSARMVAMRNATEAAEDMIDSLTLELNKARQNMITAELLDLVGGAAALEG
ncbi:MAG: ATP synthase F1 subunit gamma [Chloroflexota bacterium]|nr:ATP synthase F1 subunit gamma [Chloroflexota bacterium]